MDKNRAPPAPSNEVPNLLALALARMPDHNTKSIVPRYGNGYERYDTLDTLIPSTPSSQQDRKSFLETNSVNQPALLDRFTLRICCGYFAYFLYGWADGGMPVYLFALHTSNLFLVMSTILPCAFLDHKPGRQLTHQEGRSHGRVQHHLHDWIAVLRSLHSWVCSFSTMVKALLLMRPLPASWEGHFFSKRCWLNSVAFTNQLSSQAGFLAYPPRDFQHFRLAICPSCWGVSCTVCSTLLWVHGEASRRCSLRIPLLPLPVH